MNGNAADSPIERYLDRLYLELRRSPARQARAMLNEAEAHLRDAAHDAMAQGLEARQAELQAVARFGDARLVARQDRQRAGLDVVRQVFVSGWWLGSLGSIAVGVSGLVALGMRLGGASNSFLAGDQPMGRLTRSACAGWMQGYPRAHTCQQAAFADWASDVVLYRVALGLFGLLALAAFFGLRRRLNRPGWGNLPATVTDTIAVTLFGATGAWCAAFGLDLVVNSGGLGAGLWLSAAPVALAAAGFYVWRLVRDLRLAWAPPVVLLPG